MITIATAAAESIIEITPLAPVFVLKAGIVRHLE